MRAKVCACEGACRCLGLLSVGSDFLSGMCVDECGTHLIEVRELLAEMACAMALPPSSPSSFSLRLTLVKELLFAIAISADAY